MTKVFINWLVLSSLFFETKLIYNGLNDIFSIGFKPFNNDVLTFSFDKFVIPVAIKYFFIVPIGFIGDVASFQKVLRFNK
jgi:hypothetical protein